MSKILLVSPQLKELSDSGRWGQLDDMISASSREIDSFLFDLHLRDYFEKNGLTHHFRDYKKAIAPTGLLSIAGALREDGHNVEYVQMGIEPPERVEDLVSQSDLIGITAKCTTLPSVFEYAHRFKELNPATRVVVGGPHITASNDNFLEKTQDVDVFVKGEGEDIMVELARDPHSSTKLASLEGIQYRHNGRHHINSGVNAVDVTQLPAPAFDLVQDRDDTQLYLELSRGCNYSCRYCVESSARREKSMEQIVRDLEALETYRRHSTVHIIDSDFAASSEFLSRFEEAVASAEPTNRFIVQTRIARMNPETIERMYANCVMNIYFGFESFSDNVLSTVRKGQTWNQIYEGLVNLADNAPNIGFYRGNFIQGLPGENAEEREVQIQRRNQVLTEGLIETMKDFVFMPVPGSDIHDNPEKYGLTFESGYEPDVRTALPRYHYKNGFTSEEIFVFNMNLRRLRNNYLAKKYDLKDAIIDDDTFTSMVGE